MAFSDDEVAELKRLCPEALRCEEAGCVYLLLPGLKLPEGCSPSRPDALLCPTDRDGYPSRLFFGERVQSKATLNWNADGIRILERNWHAFSWKTGQGLRLAQMVAAHLKALR